MIAPLLYYVIKKKIELRSQQTTYANFSFNLCFIKMGTSEIMANTPNITKDVKENALSFADIVCNVCPACIATKDGGATPKNVPRANGIIGTPITGAVKLINQFGKKGVTRKNTM